MLYVFLAVGCTFLLFSFIHYAAKSKKPFKRAFLSMVLGIAVLCAVNCLSNLIGVYIPVTKLTLLTSMIGGVPGVALLVLLTAL